jgi:hypothetical protein
MQTQATHTVSIRAGRKLADGVLEAKSSGDVERLLAAVSAEFGQLHWRDLGDRPNNAGTVQIASSGSSALIERVTNAIDAMLELKAEQHTGELPTSPREAARTWFGIPRGGIGELTEKERRALAANISVTLEDSGEHQRPTVCVGDRGIGQHPADAPATLLSLNENNKVSRPYLQGAYGQGAAATYRFGRYTLILTRRKPSLNGGREDLVGWTVVWEDPGDPEVDKLPIYRYFVDAAGEIPVFDPALLQDPAWHGVRVTHIAYDLRGYAAAYTQPKNGAWALLHSSLFDPVLPFLVGGSRAVDVKTAGTDSTRVVIGNAARLNNPSGPRGDLNVAYRNSETHDLGKATGQKLGKFEVNYWVLQRPPQSVSTSDPTASYVGPDNAVTMTLSGQRQDAESRAWLRNRTELPFLVRNLVVQIDVDGLSPIAKRELFASTRERAVDSDLRERIYTEVAVALKQDGELRRLEREERDKLLAQSTEQVDEKVRERLRKHIQTLLKDKMRKVKRTSRVPVGGGGGGGGGARDTDDSHLPAVPTHMRFLRDPITIKRGGTTTVWVEINAKNGYLPDHEDDLSVTFDPTLNSKVSDIAKSRLLGGRSLWRLQAAADAPLGEYTIEAILVTASGVIAAPATLKVIEPTRTKTKTTTTEEPDNGPVIKWMHRKSWDALGWDAQTVGEVQVRAEETLILLNRDQRLLERALDRNKKLTKEQIQTRESRYLFPVSCGLYEQYEAAKDMKEPPSPEYVKGELERLAEAVLLVIDQDAFANDGGE